MTHRVDNTPMKLIRHRKLALPTNVPNEISIWEIPVAGPGDKCMPLSALGVFIHNQPLEMANGSHKHNVYVQLEIAYKARADQETLSFFHLEKLELLHLHVAWNFATYFKAPEKALNSPFKWISNRQQVGLFLNTPIKNNAFMVILKRPEDDYQHAITITCDGLWKKNAGFGFQDTQYTDNSAIRVWYQFNSQDALNQGFAHYLKTFNYEKASIQAVAIEYRKG